MTPAASRFAAPAGKVFVLALLVPQATTSMYAPPTTPPQVEWIRDNAIVFETVKAGHGFADLEPLRRIIGEARIVALGEPTHGSREVFQMKHRLLEFLVAQLGFSVFSIEANMPESFRLTDYVLHGRGDPRDLIRGMYFWTWSTEEVREMVEWMRRHNAEPDDRRRGPRVRFTGFDVQTPDVAAEIVERFVEEADPGYVKVAREAGQAARAAKGKGGETFGVATATFPVAGARGRTLTYRGWIRTEGLEDGYAGLWWRCDVGRESRGFDNMSDRGPRGTTPWQPFEITMTVPEGATNINFGALLVGRGKAWFDGLEIRLDGEPVRDPPFDLDFEGGDLEGLWTPARGYRVVLDGAVARSGRQSLRIEGAPSPKTETGQDAEAVAARWQAVVGHLERSRERYGSGQQVALEWAIANARLVKDAMDVRSGRYGSDFERATVRDRAMARTVAWILEQSPKERIVLWAHNGHVQRQPGWMGAFLEDRFPGQMVVLGFATGTGTYRAVSRAGQGLMSHGLVSPPPDSFEHFLQAAGRPRLILDLRKAVPGSADSGWVHERRRFRSIGAMEMAEQFQPLDVADAFDAIVWIEETSAAVPLGR